MLRKTHFAILFLFVFLISFSSCSGAKKEMPVCSFSDLAETLATVEKVEHKTAEQIQIVQEERAKVEEIYLENKQLLADLKIERKLLEAEHKRIKQTTKPCVCGNLSDARLKRITPLQVVTPPTAPTNQANQANQINQANSNNVNTKDNNKNLELLRNIQNDNNPISPELDDSNKIIDPPYAPSDAPL